MPNGNRFSPNTVRDASSHAVESNLTEEQLLDAYLAMPKKLRDSQFIDTFSAAEMAGISQRTIELWIEGGRLQAVLIGKKYKVSVFSLVAYLKSQLHKK